MRNMATVSYTHLWATGSVQGLVARGGFVVDMNWNGVQLDKAKIHSRLGGNLRLRSYVPLRGVGLKEAKGKNPNEYYMQAEIKEPLVTKEINPQYPALYKVYEYDLMTEQGQDYICLLYTSTRAVSHPRLPAGVCSVARRTITAGFRVTGTEN